MLLVKIILQYDLQYDFTKYAFLEKSFHDLRFEISTSPEIFSLYIFFYMIIENALQEKSKKLKYFNKHAVENEILKSTLTILRS